MASTPASFGDPDCNSYCDINCDVNCDVVRNGDRQRDTDRAVAVGVGVAVRVAVACTSRPGPFMKAEAPARLPATRSALLVSVNGPNR